MDGVGISGNVSLDMSVLNPVGVPIAGVSKYDELKDKPKINGVEVSGSKSLDDYGIASKADVESKLTGKVLKGKAHPVRKRMGGGERQHDRRDGERHEIVAFLPGLAVLNVLDQLHQPDVLWRRDGVGLEGDALPGRGFREALPQAGEHAGLAQQAGAHVERMALRPGERGDGAA